MIYISSSQNKINNVKNKINNHFQKKIPKNLKLANKNKSLLMKIRQNKKFNQSHLRYHLTIENFYLEREKNIIWENEISKFYKTFKRQKKGEERYKINNLIYLKI